MYFDVPPEQPSARLFAQSALARVENLEASGKVSQQVAEPLLDRLLVAESRLEEGDAIAADLIPVHRDLSNWLSQSQAVDWPSLEQSPSELETNLETEENSFVRASSSPDFLAPEPSPSEPAVPTFFLPDSPVPDSVEDLVQIEVEPSDELTPEEFASQLRLTADFQEYNPNSQIITARGNVVLKLNNAIIEANELWLNLVNRYALAEGDVLLTRGAQIVRGSRAEYNFIQQSGTVADAVGTLYLPDIEGDLRSPLEAPSQTSPTAAQRVYDPINRTLAVDSDGSVQIATSPGIATTGASEGNLRQLRFESDQLSFDVEGWRADAVRITNDPFSPPELELRTDSLWLRNLSPTQDELLLKRPRLVFDQGLALPLLRSRILLNRGTVDPEDLNPVPASFGIDGSDRGGFFLSREVPVYQSGSTQLSVTPQFFVAKALSGESSSLIDANNFGTTADLSTQLGTRTRLTGSAELTSFDFSNITENLRTNVRAERLIGDHRLAVQYSYRERLFNGSLGFQDVQSSFGAVLLSPEIMLGEGTNGPRLTYQASAQVINAESDRADLRANSGRATLGRFQASAALRQNFNLWRGQPLPRNQQEGLRFSPEPVVPYLDLATGIRSTGTYYTSGDFQSNLAAEIGLEGQIGHFARNFGDFTRFNIGYSQSFIGGADSPFFFDREVDRNVLSLGLTQQLYGPFLVGVQSAYSLSENRAISTIYTLEYSRRTYGILLRYDTAQNTGAIGFRLSNFSWIGDSDPFDTPRIRKVEGGVIEQR